MGSTPLQTFITGKFYIPLASLLFSNNKDPGISEDNIYNTTKKGLLLDILHRGIITLSSSLHQSTGEQAAAMELHTWVPQTSHET